MLEEAIPSIWASVHGWFTPTVLFVLVNLVIGTIAVTSKAIRPHQHHHQGEAHHHEDLRKLARSPSAVLERLRSFNPYRHLPAEIPLEAAPPPPAHRTEALESLFHAPPPDPAAGEAEGHHRHFSRSQSDASHATPSAGETPPEPEAKIKKSASANSALAQLEEAKIARLQAVASAAEEEEEEVDARADDFINRFRQQLKLQRLDSLMRYKETLNPGR